MWSSHKTQLQHSLNQERTKSHLRLSKGNDRITWSFPVNVICQAVMFKLLLVHVSWTSRWHCVSSCRGQESALSIDLNLFCTQGWCWRCSSTSAFALIHQWQTCDSVWLKWNKKTIQALLGNQRLTSMHPSVQLAHTGSVLFIHSFRKVKNCIIVAVS